MSKALKELTHIAALSVDPNTRVLIGRWMERFARKVSCSVQVRELELVHANDLGWYLAEAERTVRLGVGKQVAEKTKVSSRDTGGLRILEAHAIFLGDGEP